MPARVDHEHRRRQITDACSRITARGGLPSATFREVAAEAGVSVSLVQYYFGTKDQLLLVTQQHLAQRVAQRLRRRIEETEDAPRAIIRAIFEEFVPHDDESREAMLLFVALHTASLTDPTLRRPEAQAITDGLWKLLAHELSRARRRAGVDLDKEATMLAVLVPALAQAVLSDALTSNDALAIVDYELDRVLVTA
jgi:AcrR family transcriptional regulator